MFPIAVLAGGLGTRLYPLTATVPKSLVPVGDRPFVDHQLKLLQARGFRRVVMCVSHLGEMIEAHVGTGEAFGLDVVYSYDGPHRVGTAGAIKRALPMLGERFFTIYGDSYLDCDFRQIANRFRDSGYRALMTLFENAGELIPSNVLFRDGRIERYDKASPASQMRHVDYGVGLFESSVFDDVATDRATDLGEVHQRLIERGELMGYPVERRFFEIGTEAGIADTLAYLQARGRV